MKGILANLLIKLGLDSREFDNGMNKSKQGLDKFGGFVKKVGGLIAGAFAVERIISFGKELLQIGGIAEGVRAAFMRIADDNVLQGLKDATKGTVSELELMKRAVTANNLGLPVKNLASLFEFATKRAQDTGESVDYLVNSIVVGIGRKSPLILDNLGISAIQLKEKLKGVGLESASTAEIAAAVGEIAADSMAKSGKIIETNAIKVQQLKTAWDNFKLSLSQTPGLQEDVGKALSGITRQIELLPEDVSRFRKIWSSMFGNRASKEQKQAIAEIDASLAKFNEEIVKSNYYAALLEATKQKDIKTNEKLKTTYQDLTEVLIKYQHFVNQLDPLSFFTRTKDYDRADEKSALSLSDRLLKPEQEEDLGFDTKAWKQRLDDFAAFKTDMAYLVEDFSVEVVDKFGEAIGTMMKTGELPKDFGKQVLGILGGFISQLGKMLIALGTAALGFQELLKSAFTNPVSAALAIAAGAALVLLGGAIKGFAQAGPSGSTSTSVSSGGYSVSSQPYKPNQNNEFYGVLKGDSIYLSNQRNTYKRAVIG